MSVGDKRLKVYLAILSIGVASTIVAGVFLSSASGPMSMNDCADTHPIEMPGFVGLFGFLTLIVGLLFVATKKWAKWFLLVSFLIVNITVIYSDMQFGESWPIAIINVLEPFLFGAIIALAFTGPWLVGGREKRAGNADDS